MCECTGCNRWGGGEGGSHPKTISDETLLEWSMPSPGNHRQIKKYNRKIKQHIQNRDRKMSKQEKSDNDNDGNKNINKRNHLNQCT